VSEGTYSPVGGLPFDDEELESRLAWVWGSGRTGSTWLMELLCAPLRASRERAIGFSWPPSWEGRSAALPIDEFLISRHLVPWMGRTEELTGASRPDTLLNYLGTHPSYAFSDAYADVWRPEVRRLTLVRLYAVIERAQEAGLKLPEALPLLVIKEVNGSHAADVVMSLFPRSRMIVLLRDPRDVLDSLLDAQRSGGWLADARPLAAVDGEGERLEWVESACRNWIAQFQVVRRAYEAHDPARRRELRYERLLADTAAELGPLREWLGLPAERERVETIAERHSFDAVPERLKGPGKHYRAAQPGGWRASLSEAEQEIAGRILEPALIALGYDD
jgi:hypothetical protein